MYEKVWQTSELVVVHLADGSSGKAVVAPTGVSTGPPNSAAPVYPLLTHQAAAASCPQSVPNSLQKSAGRPLAVLGPSNRCSCPPAERNAKGWLEKRKS